jgi:hypothetical protein
VHNGDLIVGGTFDSAGQVAANGLAVWNGDQWAALGSGTDDSVLALLSVGTDLIVGGKFTEVDMQDISALAWWNGTQWSKIGPDSIGAVYALARQDQQLWVAGRLGSFLPPSSTQKDTKLSLKLDRYLGGGSSWKRSQFGHHRLSVLVPQRELLIDRQLLTEAVENSNGAWQCFI